MYDSVALNAHGTDLSLVAVTEDNGNLSLNRVAVGDHILLGGDNMDLALAHAARRKLEAQGKRLDAWQLGALTHAARSAKEALLSADGPATATLVVPNRGSQLLGGSLRCELTREEAQALVVDGFLPVVGHAHAPAQRPRSALRQRGLA